jgi:uncharacterized protein YjbJ (UPF0337 family)
VVSIVSQPVPLSFREFCCARKRLQRNIANIPAGDRQIKLCERRKSIRQRTKDKSKGKFHEVKGNLKGKDGRVANKLNPEVKDRRERIGGAIQKKFGEVEEISGAESAWVRFCDILGDAFPPSLRGTKVNRVKRR